ncbi:integrase, catalytic region, zinc finger, CCHC-type containing protein [Tanacetum coccineum]
MTTLAEHIIVTGAENRPPMLEKLMYDLWASRIRLLIKSQQLQDDCDVEAKNIILNGLPPDVFALLSSRGSLKRFSQLINDMHTIGMTMQQVQFNTKFLNALLPEWSKFVTDVKLAKSLYTTNYDKLYAYLCQHERHANEVLTQQSQAEFPQLDYGLAVPTFQQGEDPIDCINKAMAFLSAMESRGIATTSRGNYAVGQAKAIPQNSAFQTEDLDAYDSNCDDISSAKAVLMANFSSCDSDVLSEVPYSDTYLNDMINQDVQDMPYSEQTHIVDFLDNEITILSLVKQMTDHVANLDNENQTNKMVNESLTAEFERYKERVIIFEQRLIVDLNKREKLIDSKMDDLIRNRNAKFAAFQQEIDTLKETLSNQVKEKESLSTTLTVFKSKCKEKESKYMDKEIVLENQNKELENTLQTFWLKHSNTYVKSHTPVRIKSPSELPKELLVSVSKTCPSLTKPTKKLVAITQMNKDKKVRFAEPITSSSNILKQTDSLRTKDSNKPLLTSTGVNTTTSAIGSKPSGNTKKNRISRPPSSNLKNKVEEHPMKVKSSLNKMNFISEPISIAHVKHSVRNAKFESICAICNKCLFDANHDMCVIDYVNDVVQIVLWYLDSGCSKHMIGNRSQLINFVSKFLGTVRFGNDHSAKIMSYGDYQIGNVTILRFTMWKGLKTKSWLWHRRLSHVNFDYITSLAKQGLARGLLKLKYQKDHLCSACARGKSKKHSHKPKAKDFIQRKTLSSAYGSLRANKDIKNFIGYAPIKKAFQIYNKRTRMIIETIHVDFDELTAMASNEWEILFQPMFDEYVNPPPCVDHQVPTVITPEPAVSTVIPLDVKEADHDIEVAHMDNNPYVDFLIPEPSSK